MSSGLACVTDDRQLPLSPCGGRITKERRYGGVEPDHEYDARRLSPRGNDCHWRDLSLMVCFKAYRAKWAYHSPSLGKRIDVRETVGHQM